MLKSLELFGFKSFADRTRFDFSTGITGVVGPNGSGKSNVVDAMKWILGDQSAKSLRGKEMTDVIFNGSAGRKPSAYAEATITFDNSTGWLPSDAQEVQIGRRIWRNGEGEYLLNRATARLKDIKDLFMGTGAGTSAYSIIEQGRVDQILQANPTNRRAVFEEAAGISRFRARKVEAQRKLERVGQNLERLTDIVDEVEAQLNSTRNQAAKAAKYREVSVALKQWWFGLAADDSRHLTKELNDCEQRLADSAGRADELNTLHRELEEREAAFDADLSELDESLRHVERRNSSGREGIAGHDTTVQYQLARLQELETELQRLNRQQLMLGRRVVEAVDDIARHEQRLRDIEVSYAEDRHRSEMQDEQFQQASLDLAELRAGLETDRTRRLELTRSVSNSANLVSTLRTQIEALQSERAKLVSQRDLLDGELASLDVERQRCLTRVDEAVQNQTAAQISLREAQSRRLSLLGEQEDTKQKLADQRERRSASLARKSLLEDLELRQEGLGIGVKDILNRARTSNHSPWNTIIGSVADLLDVDLEHAALLEVALGPRAQLIVLREYQALLDYLNQGTVLLTNRVGFVAIPDRPVSQPIPESVQHSRFIHLQLDPGQLPDLSREPGVLMRADQLVLSDHGTTGLAPALLSDTWVVQTMPDAVRLARGAGRGLRFVTLQGELLESNGTLYAGSIRSETALFSRKSELRRLKNDLFTLDRDIAQQESQLQTVYQSLTSADSELESIAAELDYANQRLADLKSDLAAQDQTLDRLRKQRQALIEHVSQVDSNLQTSTTDLAAAETSSAESERHLQELEARLESSERETQAAQIRLQALEQQRTTAQLDLAKQGERLEALRAQSDRLNQELQQRTAQYDEAERRSHAGAAKHQQLVLNVLNTRALRDEQILANEKVAEEAAVLHARKLALRVERSRLVEQELAIRKERRDLSDRRHAEELRVRDIRSQLQLLDERLEEEYQIKLAEVVQSGASAIELIRQERQERAEAQGVRSRRAPAGLASADAETESIEASGSTAAPESTDAPEGAGTAESELAAVPSVVEEIPFAEVRPDIEGRVNRLRKQLKLMGAVNTDSLRDLEMLETRFGQLSAQLQDLVEAKKTLEDIIRKINAESRRLFAETFTTIRANFQELFRQVFGGGEGDIVLEDPEDVLDCGIDIAARPPGKELRSISLLSGGEKTMTAIALIMAIFKSKPSPFCILDEVDAALDEANVERFTAVVKAFQQTTQFIMITHHKRSMTVADVLYGVTMEESGVSKRMSVRFEDVSDDGHFRAAGQSSAA